MRPMRPRHRGLESRLFLARAATALPACRGPAGAIGEPAPHG